MAKTVKSNLDYQVEYLATSWAQSNYSALKSRPGMGMRERMLAAIAMNPQARERLDEILHGTWRRYNASVGSRARDAGYSEVIIGDGLHAAIYAAVRVRTGHAKPLILSPAKAKGTHVGGMFATCLKPGWDLNSRNREGEVGSPSDTMGLNVVPGADVQMSMISGEQFQSNADLAYIIRNTIAAYADVLLGARAVGVESGEGTKRRHVVTLGNGACVLADRVINASGMGAANGGYLVDEDALTFQQFMASMDRPFPLKGMRRVAVIGDGNSALCAAEALLGVGPGQHMSVAALDTVEQVDMYAPNLPVSVDAWRETMRGRYQRLGSFVRPVANGPQRLRVFPRRTSVTPVYDGVVIDGRHYDRAIICTGFQPLDIGGLNDDTFMQIGSEVVAKVYEDVELYGIGPVADIPLTSIERDRLEDEVISPVNDLKVALFRLGDKTAALARKLSVPGTPEPSVTTAPFISVDVEMNETNKAFVAALEETKSEIQGYDMDGNPLRVGDRVSFDQLELTDVLGVVVATVDGTYPYAVKRDDGNNGGGPDGSWVIVPSVKPVVRRLPVLFDDVNLKPVFEGSRVRYDDPAGDDVVGRIAENDGTDETVYKEDYPYWIGREDGITGGGPNGEWVVGVDYVGSITRLD